MNYLGEYRNHVSITSVAIILMLFTGCTKTIHDRRPTATLTPESREYFGFYLNGRGFKSELRTGNVYGTCTYKEKHPSGSTFRIQANHTGRDCISNSIEIVLDSVELKEGSRYMFGTPGPGKNYLVCKFTNECSEPLNEFTSKDNNFGFIKITKYRPDINVVTAVFSCIVTNQSGEEIPIADGYLDRHFIR